MPNLIPATITWTYALDVLSLTYTFTPSMNDGPEPPPASFVVLDGVTPLVFASAIWTTAYVYTMNYTEVGGPVDDISTKFTTPTDDFASLAGQRVAKFENQNVPELP